MLTVDIWCVILVVVYNYLSIWYNFLVPNLKRGDYMTTLIKNAIIITMDSGRVIDKGYVVIDGRKIGEVDAGEYSGTCDNTIDASGKIAMPGLINCHTHSAMTLFRGYAGGHPLEKWLSDYIFPAEDKLREPDFAAGNMLAICEMLASGTTCFMDMYFGMDTLADAVLSSGIRANMSRCTQYFKDDENFADDQRLNEAIQLYKDYHNAGNGRIRVDMGPHSVYLTNPAYLRRVHEVACEYDLRYHIHISETLTENETCFKRFGTTPTKLLESIGVIDERTVAAHCVHLDDEDIDIFVKRGAYAVHNPASNLKLASGIANTHKYIDRGMKLVIGTDGVSSNNNLDMFSEMYLASLLAKGSTLDSQAMPARTVLEAATVRGAEALGRAGETGVIKPGLAADIIIVNADAPHMIPIHSAEENVMYSAKGSDVSLTMVDGKVLYEKGEFKTIDFEKVRYEVAQSVGRVMSDV